MRAISGRVYNRHAHLLGQEAFTTIPHHRPAKGAQRPPGGSGPKECTSLLNNSMELDGHGEREEGNEKKKHAMLP